MTDLFPALTTGGRSFLPQVAVTGAGCLPTRDHDFSAVIDGEYDGAPDAGHQYVGFGATPDAAVADLVERLEEDE